MKEVIKIAQNENNDSTVQTSASNQKQQQPKKKMNIDPNKAKKVIKFLATHLHLVIIVGLIVLAIIIISGLYAFFTTMPGMVTAKVKEFGLSIWSGFSGFFTGNPTEASITSDDVKSLAQYLQNMGYDVQGYGFGDVTYDTDNSTESTKVIKAIDESTDGKKYLRSYIAANEETYALSEYSVWGGIQSLLSFRKKDAEDYSTGLIKIINTNNSIIGISLDDSRYVKIDRENEKMKLYTNTLFSFAKWGQVFSYDMSTWTSRYGRPTELFLALHLSTMMPDLSYAIATDSDFNTKVNIKLQPVTVTYDVTATGNSGTTSLTSESIMKTFLQNSVSYKLEITTKTSKTGRTINGYNVPQQEPTEETETVSITPSIPEEDLKKIFKEIMEQSHSNKGWSFNRNVYEDSPKGTIAHLFKDYVGSNSSDYTDSESPVTITTTITRTAVLTVTINADDTNISSVDLTSKQLLELADLVYGGQKGIQNVGWPHIESVTNHWYYEDIDFVDTKNNTSVYGKASKAHKTIEFVPEDEDTALNKNNNIKLDAILSSSDGVIYQVTEPEAIGPNEYISNLFAEQYYRYDGTVETAKNIANQKTIDEKGIGSTYNFGGDIYTSEENTNAQGENLVQKQNVNFDNKTAALSAFSILENIHTEASDAIYRNLKELVLKLNYFTTEELTEELKKVLLWCVSTDSATENFKIDKDKNEYGIVVKNVSGKNIIAPGDASIESIEGDTITLKFKSLSSETVSTLQYIYQNDFKSINADTVLGMTMKIKGINVSKNGTEVSRGETIGTANGDITVVMYNTDKSIVDNVETYMNNEYTNKKEEIKNNQQDGIGIDETITDYTNYNVNTTQNSSDVVTNVEIFKSMFSTYPNIVNNAQAFINMQEQYHVNAVFAAAVTIVESSGGSNWASIDSSTYNWFSVRGSNGWKNYESYAEAVDDFGRLIANGSNYFKAGKNSLDSIGKTYCTSSDAWAGQVASIMNRAMNE